MHFTQVLKMKAFTSTLIVALTVCVFVCACFLFNTESKTAGNLKQQENQAFKTANLWRRIKRHVSSNYTSTNTTLVQNLTTTGVPTVTTRYRRTSWSTRRNTALPLDHLGFPIIPNSHRGTRRSSPPRMKQNASNPTVNSGMIGNHSGDILGEIRMRENGTRSSILPANRISSTSSELYSSKVPYTEEVPKKSLSKNRRDISLIIAKHSVWISVLASLFLSALICLTVHWVRVRRRGKLMIAPAGDKGQRSAAVVYKA